MVGCGTAAAKVGWRADLNQIEDSQLALAAIDGDDEVERRILPVDDASAGAVSEPLRCIDEVADTIWSGA